MGSESGVNVGDPALFKEQNSSYSLSKLISQLMAESWFEQGKLLRTAQKTVVNVSQAGKGYENYFQGVWILPIH